MTVASAALHSADAAVRARLLRRLDWRFLLPDPSLRSVGYLGPGNSTLASALRMFADSVSVVRPDGDEAAPVDLLVAESADSRAVARALQWLGPGGCLYWERTPFDVWWTQRPAELSRNGITSISAYWHYRGFDSCRWVVPLDNPHAIETLLSRKFPSVSERLRMRASEVLAHSPFVRRLLTTSVIGRREVS